MPMVLSIFCQSYLQTQYFFAGLKWHRINYLHKIMCPAHSWNVALTSVGAVDLCLINASQREKKQCWLSSSVANAAPLERRARHPGWWEFSFHDSSFPGLLWRQPASGQSVTIVMGRWWWGCSAISIFHKSHSKALPLQESRTKNCL